MIRGPLADDRARGMWYNENYLRCPFGHKKGSPVKSRRGSATVSEGSCFEVPLGQ
jgi:hypothetical protein